jgi:transcriptional regulator
MQSNPFATLITSSMEGVEANHLPMRLVTVDDEEVLHGHIAKVNPLWRNSRDGAQVLAIFHGPNCYVSPNYYPTKQETGRAVPTWNYVVVHVSGRLRFVHDENWNLAMLNTLTSQHEATQAQPWSTADAPKAYIDKMLPAIVGIEISKLSISGNWKLSQNQPEENKRGVVAGLSSEDDNNAKRIAELIDTN